MSYKTTTLLIPVIWTIPDDANKTQANEQIWQQSQAGHEQLSAYLENGFTIASTQIVYAGQLTFEAVLLVKDLGYEIKTPKNIRVLTNEQ